MNSLHDQLIAPTCHLSAVVKTSLVAPTMMCTVHRSIVKGDNSLRLIHYTEVIELEIERERAKEFKRKQFLD